VGSRTVPTPQPQQHLTHSAHWNSTWLTLLELFFNCRPLTSSVSSRLPYFNLYWSSVQQLELWPITDFLELCPVTALLQHWPISDFLELCPITALLQLWPITNFLELWPISDFLELCPVTALLQLWPISDLLELCPLTALVQLWPITDFLELCPITDCNRSSDQYLLSGAPYRNYWLTACHRRQCNQWLVSQSVLMSGLPLGPMNRFFLFFSLVWQLLDIVVGPPLWREDGSVICSDITHWLESCKNNNHTVLSHLRLPQPGGPGSHIYIPQKQGGPVIPPGYWVPFTSPLMTRRATVEVFYPASTRVTSKSKSHYDRQLVGQSVLVSGANIRHLSFCCCPLPR
jgi:hypothetical protein